MSICDIQIIGNDTKERVIIYRQAAMLEQAGFFAVGVSETAAEYEIARKAPPFGVLLACFGGQGAVQTRQGWKKIVPGQAYIAPPHVPHAYHCDGAGGWNFCWCTFIENGTAEWSTINGPALVPFDAEPLRLAILGLYLEWHTCADLSRLSEWSRLINSYACQARGTGTQIDERLIRLWRNVNHNLSRKWTLKELSRLACLSPEQLRNLCNKQLGRSPMAHLTRLRMQHAAILLELHPEMKLREVADSAGYTNEFAFSVAFKKHFKLSPSTWAVRHEKL